MAKQHIPKTLGRYRLVREIGRGAMGVVYEGIDPVIGRRVAIKAARRDLLDEDSRADEMMERFIREAHAAGQLNHPGIITIYDADQEKDIAFIAMEFMAGGSLKDRIRDRGKLEPKEAVKIAIAICNALAAAHDKGVVHRDVKPANILMNTDGSIKVADFGIARLSDSTLTQDGAIVGTPYCMSPEQVMGQKVDGRSDIFSVGVILYEMLTGERPFVGDVFGAILHKIVNDEPVPPHALVRVNENLSRVVMKSLSKAPEKRYQDGRVMAAALRESLKEKPNPDVLALNADAAPKTTPPQHDASTVLSMISPGRGDDAFLGPSTDAAGSLSSFTPRVSRMVKRRTLLPAILTTMLFLIVGVMMAVFVLGNQNSSPPGQNASSTAQPEKPAAPPLPTDQQPKEQPQKTAKAKESAPESQAPEKAKSPDKPKKDQTAETSRKRKADDAQTKQAEQPKTQDKEQPAPKKDTEAQETKPAKPEAEEKKPEEKKEAPQPEQPAPAETPKPPETPTPAAPPAEQPPQPPKAEPQQEQPKAPETPPAPPAPPAPTEKPVAPPSEHPQQPQVPPQPPAAPPEPPPAVPAPPTTPQAPAAQTEQPAAPATPPDPAVTPAAPPVVQPQLPKNEMQDLAQLGPVAPPPVSAADAQSILAELPSVGQLTVNLWFADTQEAWNAASNDQLPKGDRYTLCGTAGTVTAVIRDAAAPMQPIIDTQVIISSNTIAIKTPSPQIRVTYEREGYVPVEKEYSADSPGQAVTADIVMKNLNCK